jgi:hypothetical protein
MDGHLLDTHKSPHHRLLALLRYGWPILVLLAILWFPFDWLSTVWPAFGIPFRMVFRNSHDHFIGHTVFFFIVGFLALADLPRLRRAPHWYLLGLVVAALMQETIQAVFRGQVPTFTDTNAFTGDALGGIGAFLVWGVIQWEQHVWRKRASQRDTLA